MHLPRRPVRPLEQAAAARRVQDLLPSAPVGWVPPACPDDAGNAEPEVAVARTPDEGAEGQEPAAGAWGRTADDTVARGPVVRRRHAARTPWWSGRSRARATDRPVRSDDRVAGEVDEDPVAPADSHPGSDQPPVVPSLRDRLAAGRLDPGKRAVVGLGVVAAAAALLAGLLVLRSAPRDVAAPRVEQVGRPVVGAAPTLAGPEAQERAGEVVVAVAGTVRRPGLVRLAAGSRVDDALRAAGGLTAGASPGLLNLARKVVDGEQVLVGVEAQAAVAPGAAGPDAAGPGAGGATAGGLVDLNRATAADLDALPGIGPVLAQRILDHRTAQGPFRSVDQLREVSGIGEAKFSSLRDAVTV